MVWVVEFGAAPLALGIVAPLLVAAGAGVTPAVVVVSAAPGVGTGVGVAARLSRASPEPALVVSVLSDEAGTVVAPVVWAPAATSKMADSKSDSDSFFMVPPNILSCFYSRNEAPACQMDAGAFRRKGSGAFPATPEPGAASAHRPGEKRSMMMDTSSINIPVKRSRFSMMYSWRARALVAIFAPKGTSRNMLSR